MGRFISGSAEDTGFTRAEVYTTPGSTTWTVPAGVSKAKVFVIGAGSCFRTTEFCFESSSTCCSGVAVPGTVYCLNFFGHLPGAGGGYAEKTIEAVSPGSTMTINVGSPTGLTASSASINGTTVTANNATEIAVSWNCLDNSTARDDSNDNKVSLGFDLPVCGYRNCINGYFNVGGTATGGDINRTGGRGEFAPYFRAEAKLDGAITIPAPVGAAGAASAEGCTFTYNQNSGYDYSFGGTRYNCVCTVVYLKPNAYLNNGNCGCCFNSASGTQWTCSCLITYHNVFGGQCYYNMNWASCVCYCLCASTYLCVSGAVASGSGTTIAPSAATDKNAYPRGYDEFAVGSCPVTIGSSAGSSGANGQDGVAESMIFGPHTGASSAAAGVSDTVVCYVGFSQDHYTFYFGSGISNWPCAAFENLYSSGGGGSGYYALGYSKDSASQKKSPNVIPLSTLKSRTGTNVGDLEFGSGATVNEAASIGGGGNRLYPAGGSGAVVVVY